MGKDRFSDRKDNIPNYPALPFNIRNNNDGGCTMYKIKNWEEYQHYKDRNPPWIKLHIKILNSKDWVKFNDASKLLAVVCMMLASQNNGVVEGDLDYIKQVAHLNKLPDLKPLIKAGFLIPLADASTMQADAIIEERREETEERRDREEYIDVFNSVLGKQAKMTDNRKRQLNNFAKKISVQEFTNGLQKVLNSDFMMNKWTGWTFDWFINENNFTKLIEGAYDGQPKQSTYNSDRGGKDTRSTSERIADAISSIE